MNFYKIDKEDIIILVDDMDTDPGHIRLKLKGSAGGHNGLKSIIQVLGTDVFKRIRIGIGRPDIPNTADFVLSSPRDKGCLRGMEGWHFEGDGSLEYALKFSFDKAMNLYNR